LIKLLLAILLIVLSIFSYASDSGKPYRQTGIASWYGRESGNHTANGERFKPYGFTAASWHLPFNSRVKVTNLANGKSVIVRINDRGPAHRLHRLIDLSQAAAQHIGIEGLGLVLVAKF
jgi:rare lipoprotein A